MVAHDPGHLARVHAVDDAVVRGGDEHEHRAGHDLALDHHGAVLHGTDGEVDRGAGERQGCEEGLVEAEGADVGHEGRAEGEPGLADETAPEAAGHQARGRHHRAHGPGRHQLHEAGGAPVRVVVPAPQPGRAGVDGPGHVERAEPVDPRHLDRREVGALADVDREADVAGLQRHEPAEHDPGPDLGHVTQRAPQGGPDDVGQRDPLARLGAHPIEVGERGADVDLHPRVDPAVTRRAPGGDGDLPAHRRAAPVHGVLVGIAAVVPPDAPSDAAAVLLAR